MAKEQEVKQQGEYRVYHYGKMVVSTMGEDAWAAREARFYANQYEGHVRIRRVVEETVWSLRDGGAE
jgi:hypothetical protein